jgi:chemotaxis protein MotB
MNTIRLTLLFCSFIFITSCVSKKKYRTEISNLQKDYNTQVIQLDKNLRVANRSIDSLTLKLAESRGANNALLTTQDKLQDRIDELQDNVEELKKTANEGKKSSNQLVREKEAVIANKQAQLDKIGQLIEDREKAMNNIAVELANSMRSIDSLGKHHEVEIIDGKLVVTLYESLMFHPKDLRVRTGGIQMLGLVSEVLEKYPQFQIEVEGHTDNRSVRGYKSNWNFSAQRAAAVVDVLTDEYGLSPNKFSAVGKGEFSPNASNEMTEGRASNRRIEIIISPRTDIIINQIKRALE